ncbi:MAG: lysophospholipid acyltransferase family protein [Patescibacteria group bacterium]|jgi:1-acyl-sn-glycerol-3-phosphate acyltransferase
MDKPGKPIDSRPEFTRPAEREVLPVHSVERDMIEPAVIETGAPVEAEDSAKEKRKQTEQIAKSIEGEFSVAVRPNKVYEYLERNLPVHLRRANNVRALATPVMALVGEALFMIEGRKVEGRENIPRHGPCLLVSNHTRDSDQFTLAAVARRPLDFAAADMHFQINPAITWFLKKIGVFEVKSSLGNLTAEEQAELMTRVPKKPKHVAKYYQTVIDRPVDLGSVRKFARESAALLARGDAVAMFPEGLWTYEGPVLRKAYPGIEIVNNEYRRLTGEDAPIVPIAISDKRVQIGESLTLGQGDSVHTVMAKIAGMLPVEERGYYGSSR